MYTARNLRNITCYRADLGIYFLYGRSRHGYS